MVLMMAKKVEEKKEEKKLFKGFCDRENCEFYLEKEDISFTAPDNKGIIELCTFGDTKRSFGCLSGCPNSFGRK